MRRLVMSCIAVLVAVALSGLGTVKGQDGAPTSPGTASTDSASQQPSSRFQIGDKVKLSFFETVDLTGSRLGEPGGTGAAALRTFYQRMDLSGEYTIDQDGSISLPLLGRFVLEGRQEDDVQSQVASAFASTIGRSANLQMRIIERAPIYVVGPVKTPGAYKYVPGMIVLQAIALAGGLDGGNPATMVDGAREVERLRIKSLQINQLLARKARLEAERDGASEFTAPMQLVGSVAVASAHSALDTEIALFQAEKARRHQKQEETAMKIALSGREIEALKHKLEQNDAQKALRTERLNEVQKLKDQGWAPSNSVITLRTELSDLEARRQDYLIALLQAQTRLAETGETATQLRFNDKADNARSLAEVNKELAIAQEVVSSAQTIGTLLNRSFSGERQSYEIVRRSKEGSRIIEAGETSALLPGDVLKIVSRSAMVAPSAVQLPQSQGTIVSTAEFANAR